jgi:phosphatidylcholine synthase
MFCRRGQQRGSRLDHLDGRTVGRFSIHVLTAAGAACALLAMMAAVAEHWAGMFAWLGLALAVDAADGTLDLVVDFATYVFVPAYAIAASGLLPAGLGAPAGVLVVVTGALYFADRAMKTPDNYFRGFPALWNVAAFYLLLLRPGPVAATASVTALAVGTFVPFPFIHPLRVRRHRAFNVAVLAVWAVLAVAALV